MAWSAKRVSQMRKLLSHGLLQSQVAREMKTSQQVISYQCKLLRRKYYGR